VTTTTKLTDFHFIVAYSHDTVLVVLFAMFRDELPEDAKAAAKKLGYTKKHWDKDKEPKECDEEWKDLTPEQQA
jgi:hypothetical protein